MSGVIKNGKVDIEERKKYEQATLQSGDALSVPEFLTRHFQDLSLVYKWISKAKLASNGGRHPSGWIPYEMSTEQKSVITEKGGYGIGVVNGPHLERGDMVLAVKPLEAHQAHAKSLREKTIRQTQSMEDLVDAAGKKMIDRGKKPVS